MTSFISGEDFRYLRTNTCSSKVFTRDILFFMGWTGKSGKGLGQMTERSTKLIILDD